MPGYGHRYWEERTGKNRRRTYPIFKGDRSADVVVIGAGLVGSTAAYVLAHAGLDVVVVEADRVANGATAGGLGVLLPEPAAKYVEVERATGRRVARRAWKEARRSALEFASALRRLKAKVDLLPAPLTVNA